MSTIASFAFLMRSQVRYVIDFYEGTPQPGEGPSHDFLLLIFLLQNCNICNSAETQTAFAVLCKILLHLDNIAPDFARTESQQ